MWLARHYHNHIANLEPLEERAYPEAGSNPAPAASTLVKKGRSRAISGIPEVSRAKSMRSIMV
jgi:hypothetical protein